MRIKYEHLYLPAASVGGECRTGFLRGQQIAQLSFALAVDSLNPVDEHLRSRLDSVP
jgi:hypothetical protein